MAGFGLKTRWLLVPFVVAANSLPCFFWLLFLRKIGPFPPLHSHALMRAATFTSLPPLGAGAVGVVNTHCTSPPPSHPRSCYLSTFITEKFSPFPSSSRSPPPVPHLRLLPLCGHPSVLFSPLSSTFLLLVCSLPSPPLPPLPSSHHLSLSHSYVGHLAASAPAAAIDAQKE